MKPYLETAFTVDLAKKTIDIDRPFAAPLPLVWQAWTDPELLDQWWGPAPCRAETKSMDFREGGRWLYAMIIPVDQKKWSKVDYISIEPLVQFTARDGFCDENGIPDPQLPENLWVTRFEKQAQGTLVQIHLQFDSEEDLKTIVSMGFKEGFQMGLNQLDRLLSEL